MPFLLGVCSGGALVRRLRPARSSRRGSYVRRSCSSRGAVLPVVTAVVSSKGLRAWEHHTRRHGCDS
jgi:hypothetical protein